MSLQKQDHPSVKVCIVGVSGVGKTTLFERLIRRAKSARYVFLYDHKDGDMQQRFGIPSCASPDELIAAVEGGRRFLIYNPHEMFPGDSQAGFAFFCKFVWEVGRQLRGVKIVGADELDSICDERCKPLELVKMLNLGRTFQFDAYFIAQSMNGMHNQVRKQITEIFAMRQGDANGIEWLAKKGFAGAVFETLPNGCWLYANTNTGEKASGGKPFEPKGASRDLRGL